MPCRARAAPSQLHAGASGFAEVGRFKNGKGVGEGVRWSPDRAYALKLLDGRVVGTFPARDEPTVAISSEEAERIAAEIGLPMPPPAVPAPPEGGPSSDRVSIMR